LQNSVKKQNIYTIENFIQIIIKKVKLSIKL